MVDGAGAAVFFRKTNIAGYCSVAAGEGGGSVAEVTYVEPVVYPDGASGDVELAIGVATVADAQLPADSRGAARKGSVAGTVAGGADDEVGADVESAVSDLKNTGLPN